MRSVTFRKDGVETKYATNNDGYGLFVLRGGAYVQLRGTGQTPKFNGFQQFVRYIRRVHPKPGLVVLNNFWYSDGSKMELPNGKGEVSNGNE